MKREGKATLRRIQIFLFHFHFIIVTEELNEKRGEEVTERLKKEWRWTNHRVVEEKLFYLCDE